MRHIFEIKKGDATAGAFSERRRIHIATMRIWRGQVIVSPLCFFVAGVFHLVNDVAFGLGCGNAPHAVEESQSGGYVGGIFGNPYPEHVRVLVFADFNFHGISPL